MQGFVHYITQIFNRNQDRVKETGTAEERPPERVAPLIPFPSKKECSNNNFKAAEPSNRKTSLPSNPSGGIFKQNHNHTIQTTVQRTNHDYEKDGKIKQKLIQYEKVNLEPKKALEKKRMVVNNMKMSTLANRIDPRVRESQEKPSQRSQIEMGSQQSKKGFDNSQISNYSIM